MEELILKIEETVTKLLEYDLKEYAESAEELASMMMEEFPKIIMYYANPGMKEYAADAGYWPSQLERIIKAFETGDDFATADILCNETRANLIELNSILKEKGII